MKEHEVEEIVVNTLIERLRLQVDGNGIKLMLVDYPSWRVIDSVFINKEDL